jgi:nitrate reductase beta subunit
LEHLHIWKTRTHNFQFPNFNDYYDDFLFENEMNQSKDNVDDNPKRIVPLETN